MRTIQLLVAACMLLPISAHAAEATTAAAGKATNASAAGKARAATADGADASGGAKAIKMSQQDRMRMCNKQATGKKGPERKSFMKSCLTTKKA